MNVLSLFDGISCGQLALQRAGIKVNKYFASEIDKYAIKITQKNFPETIQLGDVNNFEEWDLPQVDLLIGGSPCQDLSIAKQDRKGLDGERSGLFWRYVDCLRKFKPKYFLLENVASMPKEAKETITKTLGVEPIMINSALVSAQQRKRLYWTNIPNIGFPKDKGVALKDILISENDEAIRIPKYGDQTKSRPITSHYSNNCGGWIDRINDPNPAKQQVDLIAEPICVNSQSGCRSGVRKQPSVADRIYDVNAKNPSLSSSYQTNIAWPIRIGEIGKTGQANRVYSVRGKSVCLNANGGGGGAKTGLYKIDLPDGDYIIRKLYPLECERLQTLPDNYTLCECVSNTQRYKCIGNAWTVDVIAHILKNIK